MDLELLNLFVFNNVIISIVMAIFDLRHLFQLIMNSHNLYH